MNSVLVKKDQKQGKARSGRTPMRFNSGNETFFGENETLFGKLRRIFGRNPELFWEHTPKSLSGFTVFRTGFQQIYNLK